MPDGRWIHSAIEIIMTTCDLLFGHGTWYWAQIGTWILLEGIISPIQIYGQTRKLQNLQVISNNSYYQGKFLQLRVQR